MDAGIIIVAAIVGASIIGAFIMMSRRGGETGEDTGELVRLAEEKAKAESELASTRADLDVANQQLDTARQFEIQNATLTSDLANEKALQTRTAEQLQSTQSGPRNPPISSPETHRRNLRTQSRTRRQRRVLTRRDQRKLRSPKAVYRASRPSQHPDRQSLKPEHRAQKRRGTNGRARPTRKTVW